MTAPAKTLQSGDQGARIGQNETGRDSARPIPARRQTSRLSGGVPILPLLDGVEFKQTTSLDRGCRKAALARSFASSTASVRCIRAFSRAACRGSWLATTSCQILEPRNA